MQSPSLKAFSLTVPTLRVISLTDSLVGLCHVYSKRIRLRAPMALRARFLVFFAHLPVGARNSILLGRRNVGAQHLGAIRSLPDLCGGPARRRWPNHLHQAGPAF